jgi:signal transduction histidine kinase
LIEKERLEKKDLSFQIAALAHDVKTPLTVVKGNVELLEMTSLTSKQVKYLRIASDLASKLYFSA